MEYKITEMQSNVLKGDLVGTPAFCPGKTLRYVGLPVKAKSGAVDLRSPNVSFEGSFDGSHWFTVCTPSGARVIIRCSGIVQGVIPPEDSLAAASVVLPLDMPQFLEGLVMIRPVLTLKEETDKLIQLFFLS